jgi:hypothetical protein
MIMMLSVTGGVRHGDSPAGSDGALQRCPEVQNVRLRNRFAAQQLTMHGQQLTLHMACEYDCWHLLLRSAVQA